MGSGLRVWHGSLGSFVVDPTNNAAHAGLAAASPTGPYILDEATHAARVKAYFVGAGLPADQIGEVQATYQSGLMGGSMTTPGGTPVVESINSILRRRVSGILIVESEAWAKMTTAGDVDMEYVFWPPIDMAVVNQAVALAGHMADASAHAAYVAKLPGTVRNDVGVVIHHTDAGIHASPTAYVAYDAVIGTDPHAAARHFDGNGQEFRLPQEQAAPTYTTHTTR
jgi:hypothetical protein